ncbi:MAG: hypothetical protein R3B13_03435 [Polyangiaceae bacterium]
MKRWKAGFVGIFAVAASIGFAGCGDDGSGGGKSPGNDAAVDTFELAVGPEGGFLDAGDLFVSVPPGALDSTVTLSVKKKSRSSLAPDSVLSEAFELAPDGQAFNGPVLIGVRVDAEATADPGVMVSRRMSDGTWEDLATRVTAGWALASTPHFSTYAARPASPANSPCAYSQVPIPLYVPGNLEVANATKIDDRTQYGGVASGSYIELSTPFKTDQRYVTLRGIAGPPSGNGALYNITKQTVTPLPIDSSGRFSVDIDVLTDGPWFGLADACNPPTQPGGAAWRMVQVECTEKCQLVPDAGTDSGSPDSGSDAGADAGPLTCPFPKTIAALPVSSWHEAYLHYRPGDYCDLQTDVKPGTIVLFRIFSGSRTAAAIPGAYRWDIHTMSHGNLQGGTWLNLPDATDITMDISPYQNPVATHRVVYRFDGTNVTIKSLDPI